MKKSSKRNIYRGLELLLFVWLSHFWFPEKWIIVTNGVTSINIHYVLFVVALSYGLTCIQNTGFKFKWVQKDKNVEESPKVEEEIKESK